MKQRELVCGDVVATVSPASGGVIGSLRFGGREVLAHMPWTARPLGPAADERTWVESWNGGWQLLIPNAGERSGQSQPPQGFHGNASVQPWQVIDSDDAHCTLEWSEAGLSVRRVITLTGSGLLVTTQMTNDSAAEIPVIATEHCILGADALASEGSLGCSGSVEVEQLDYSGAPLNAPAVAWAGADLAAVGSDTPAGLFVLHGVGDEGVEYRTSKLALRLTWDATSLPYMWLWRELQATQDEPWCGKVRALGLEPSNTNHGLGLDFELSRGTTKHIPPGQSLTWWMRLERLEQGERNG